MGKKHKNPGRTISVPAGVVLGVVAGVAVMLLGAVLLAYLIINERLGMEAMGIGTAVITALSTAAGAWVACAVVKQKKLMVAGLVAIAFFLVLLGITATFFDGLFADVGITALMILVGAGCCLLVTLRKKTGKSKIKIPAYR